MAIGIFLACATALGAQSATPQDFAGLLRYSGQLTDVAGQRGTGPVTLTFALYDAPTGGALLWSETRAVEPDAEGKFSVLLGATTNGIPAQVFAQNAARWLSVQLQGQEEPPRVQLVAVAYAFKAADADTLGGRPSSDFLRRERPAAMVGSGDSGGSRTEARYATNYLLKGSGSDVSNTDSIIYDNGTSVAIGTTTPTTGWKAVIKSDSALRLVGSASDDAFELGVWVGEGSTWALFQAYNRALSRSTPLWMEASKFSFQIGNVGIGVLTPTEKLDVNGNINVSGNINAKYQDIAEWVETPQPLEPGTVVIVDPTESNRVLMSPRAYDTRVAGAISHQPGLALGEKSDTKVLVAHSGRVRIKVDAKYGAIKIGDLLVTSPTPGHAMRSRMMKVGDQFMHRPGTLLGKALEALPKGKGEILVLITIQ